MAGIWPSPWPGLTVLLAAGFWFLSTRLAVGTDPPSGKDASGEGR